MGDTSVELTVYGEAGANDVDVAFPISSALRVAAAAYRLADAVSSSRATLNTLDSTHLSDVDFKGPHADVSEGKVEAYRTSATNMATGLRAFAGQIAEGWAAARGQQDRINFARYCEDESSNDGWGENAWESVAGEDDYGPPPENPAVPSAPGFSATREPQYPGSARDRHAVPWTDDPPTAGRPTVTQVTANPVSMQEFVTGVGTAKGTLADAQTTEAATVRAFLNEGSTGITGGYEIVGSAMTALIHELVEIKDWVDAGPRRGDRGRRRGQWQQHRQRGRVERSPSTASLPSAGSTSRRWRRRTSSRRRSRR